MTDVLAYETTLVIRARASRAVDATVDVTTTGAAVNVSVKLRVLKTVDDRWGVPEALSPSEIVVEALNVSLRLEDNEELNELLIVVLELVLVEFDVDITGNVRLLTTTGTGTEFAFVVVLARPNAVLAKIAVDETNDLILFEDVVIIVLIELDGDDVEISVVLLEFEVKIMVGNVGFAVVSVVAAGEVMKLDEIARDGGLPAAGLVPAMGIVELTVEEDGEVVGGSPGELFGALEDIAPGEAPITVEPLGGDKGSDEMLDENGGLLVSDSPDVVRLTLDGGVGIDDTEVSLGVELPDVDNDTEKKSLLLEKDNDSSEFEGVELPEAEDKSGDVAVIVDVGPGLTCVGVVVNVLLDCGDEMMKPLLDVVIDVPPAVAVGGGDGCREEDVLVKMIVAVFVEMVDRSPGKVNVGTDVADTLVTSVELRVTVTVRPSDTTLVVVTSTTEVVGNKTLDEVSDGTTLGEVANEMEDDVVLLGRVMTGENVLSDDSVGLSTLSIGHTLLEVDNVPVRTVVRPPGSMLVTVKMVLETKDALPEEVAPGIDGEVLIIVLDAEPGSSDELDDGYGPRVDGDDRKTLVAERPASKLVEVDRMTGDGCGSNGCVVGLFRFLDEVEAGSDVGEFRVSGGIDDSNEVTVNVEAVFPEEMVVVMMVIRPGGYGGESDAEAIGGTCITDWDGGSDDKPFVKVGV